MLLNLYRDCPTNIGDKVSSPLDYFPLIGEKCDVWGVSADQLQGRKILLGGGGLAIFRESIEVLEPFAENIIVWGMGCNEPIIKPTAAKLPAMLSRCPLVGVRDWGTSFRWVPCASCMSSAFDDRHEVKHEVGFYEHWEIPLKQPGQPLLKNNCEFQEAIEFLASCETVVTNSYHGAYWSLLLGKKVLVWPINTKLFQFRHQPRVILNSDWRANMKHAVCYPDALHDCREANRSFYADVLALGNNQPGK